MGTVDDYLATLDPADADVIARIYEVARAEVPDAEQGKGYGMPALVLDGKPLLSVMRAKRHIGLYPFSGDVVAALADSLAGYSCDKGTIRFQPEKPLPDNLVREAVRLRTAQIRPD